MIITINLVFLGIGEPSPENQAKPPRYKHKGPSDKNGGHGIRTRNPFQGTSFPMRPLAIRLSSK